MVEDKGRGRIESNRACACLFFLWGIFVIPSDVP